MELFRYINEGTVLVTITDPPTYEYEGREFVFKEPTVKSFIDYGRTKDEKVLLQTEQNLGDIPSGIKKLWAKHIFITASERNTLGMIEVQKTVEYVRSLLERLLFTLVCMDK